MAEEKALPSPLERAAVGSLIGQITDARILDHLQALVGPKHPVTSPEALWKTGRYILDRMETFGLDTIEEGIEGENPSLRNLIGRTSGRGAGQNILVIGAHYDTVAESPGADDNASGLAVLLEVARVLAPLRGDLTLEFVAFSLEEEGFLGSDHYVDQAQSNKVPLWGSIILECVGYTDHRPGSQSSPMGLPIALPDRGDFIGLIGNEIAEPVRKAFEGAISNYCPDLSCISLLVPGKGELLPDSRRSDHVPFWDRGYRSVMLTDTANFRNPHYHQKSDLLSTLDIPFITKVARVLAAAVIDLAELKNRA